MKNLICCTAAAFALLAVPAAAQDKPTLNPNQMTVAFSSRAFSLVHSRRFPRLAFFAFS
jgi:polyisoprenoid-binding protein YceI